MPFLELRHVHKSYGASAGRGGRRSGERTEVLADVCLGVERGEFVAIVGYSGAGKTTLLSIMAGLMQPDAGEVRIDGRAVTEPGHDRGIVFQNYSLLPWLTAYGNVRLGIDQVFRDWPEERRRERTEQYLAMVNLTAARDKRPGELSGGMRQRVALARALAMDPAVLLMDEPLGALDALTRATLQDEIERIWERDRKTVVLITNDVDEGILLADRIVPLSAGPRAHLGPSIIVDLPRPRDRKALNRDPRFKEIRREVIDYLLASARAAAPEATRSERPDTPVDEAEVVRDVLEVGA
jgi:nitrate/nitrite transport system ATP-binding protein